MNKECIVSDMKINLKKKQKKTIRQYLAIYLNTWPNKTVYEMYLFKKKKSYQHNYVFSKKALLHVQERRTMLLQCYIMNRIIGLIYKWFVNISHTFKNKSRTSRLWNKMRPGFRLKRYLTSDVYTKNQS